MRKTIKQIDHIAYGQNKNYTTVYRLKRIYQSVFKGNLMSRHKLHQEHQQNWSEGQVNASLRWLVQHDFIKVLYLPDHKCYYFRINQSSHAKQKRKKRVDQALGE